MGTDVLFLKQNTRHRLHYSTPTYFRNGYFGSGNIRELIWGDIATVRFYCS